RLCATIKPTAAQADYIDETVPGLTLRVSKHGVKAWSLLYSANGKVHRHTFGRYPDISLGRARRPALEAKPQIADGGLKRKTDASLAAVWEAYAKREGGKLRSFEERQATINRLILPAIGPRPIDQIKRSEIVRLLDRIEDENGPRQAQMV